MTIENDGFVMIDGVPHEEISGGSNILPRHHKVKPLNIEWNGSTGYRITQKLINGGRSLRHKRTLPLLKVPSRTPRLEVNREAVSHSLGNSRPESPVLLMDEFEHTPVLQRPQTATPTDKYVREVDSDTNKMPRKNMLNDNTDISGTNGSTSRQKLLLFDAPPSLKSSQGKSTRGRVEPFYVDGTRMFSKRPMPVVIERRYRSSPSPSPLRRTNTLPVHSTGVWEQKSVDDAFHIARETVNMQHITTTKHSIEQDKNRENGVRRDLAKPLYLDAIEANQMKTPQVKRLTSTREFKTNSEFSDFATNESSNGLDNTHTMPDTRQLRVDLYRESNRSITPVDKVSAENSTRRLAPSNSEDRYVKTATTTITLPPKPIRSVQSSPSSPVLGNPREYQTVYKVPLSSQQVTTKQGIQTHCTGLPPAPRRSSPSRITRRDPSTGELLSPTGPPVEQVNTLVEPQTGHPTRVITRSQSFTDINKNVVLTEFDETIEGKETTEHRIKKRLIRKGINSPVRQQKSIEHAERSSEHRAQSKTQTLDSQRQMSPAHANPKQDTAHRMETSTEQQLRQKLDEIDELITELKTRSNDLLKTNEKPIATYPVSSWAEQPASPGRATSQTNIAGYTSLGRPQWTSDLNIRTTTNYKQMPMLSTYSAHRENLQRREEQRRATETEQQSTRYFEEGKVSGGAEVLEEVETITLQPIGRGVHDLEPTGSIGRSYRAFTPTASRAYTPGPDQSDGYRTIATTNVHREVHTSGGPSPFAARQNSLYEGRGSEHRYRTSQQSDTHWRATTVPPNYAGSVSGMSAVGDASEWEQVLLKQVKNTFREWYMPESSREDVENLLRDREPGSFIVRNRVSHENSFSLGLKAPGGPDPYRFGSIKHYIINSVPMHDGRGTGLQLNGSSDQPIFPDFVSFVHHHCMHAGPFPCALRLPMSFASSQPPSNLYGSANKVKIPAGGGGVVADMLYLGSVQVDKLETLSAVRKAVTKILGHASTNGKGLSKRSTVTISAKPNEGVKFSGTTKRGKVEESIKPTDISFCGFDPEGRTFTGEELRARGVAKSRMFGIVARSRPIWMHGNLVYVFAEVDPNQSALTLISYINQVFVN